MKIDTSLYSDLDLALMVTSGLLGNGAERRANLGTRYFKVQLLVNQIARGVMPKPASASAEDVRKALLSMKPTDSEYNEFIQEVIKKL